MKNRFFITLLPAFFLLATSARAQHLNEAFPLSPHPRLFFSRGEETRVLEQSQHDELLAQLINLLRQQADQALLKEPQVYTPNKEILSISREEVNRILTLSMAYRLFHDERYLQKAAQELLNVCMYPSWNPRHFLDVAEMTTAVAIGYDWCYDGLPEEVRKIVENAIREKAFMPAWAIYDDPKKTPFNRENNWNMVCNSGMVNGALALGDLYPEEAKKIIQYAVNYTPNLLSSFAPEGVYNEGTSYWAFNAMYMGLFFDNLIRNIRYDFGLPEYKGISYTTRFYASLIGPGGQTFNFGDASGRVDNSGTFFLFSKLYHQPATAAFYRSLLKSTIQRLQTNPAAPTPTKRHAGSDDEDKTEISRFLFLAIPWFESAIPAGSAPPAPAHSPENLQIFQGVTDMLVFNGADLSDPDRLYLAAKTGRPAWSHNHLDVGSFVLDCDGQRWALDLGPDKYSLPKFWDYKAGGMRWTYFRNTNMAHNTLNIDHKVTDPDGQGELQRADPQSPQPYGVFDMSAAYKGQAASVFRGFRLLSPHTIAIRDEIDPSRHAKEVNWHFLTNATVTIDGNTATLTQNGKTFYIRCQLPAGGYSFRVYPAVPFTDKEKPIEGVTIIEISVPVSGKPVAIPVSMGNRPEELNASAAIPVLQEWK